MMMKGTSWFVAVLGLAAAPAMAQSTEIKTETKVEVKDGKDVKLTGCVERLPEAGAAARYRLADVADATGKRHSYLLVGKDGELERHVGHMVEVKGKAADREDGKVKVKTKTKVDREDADDLKNESEAEVKGDLIGLPLLGVDDVKMIRPTCS